MIVAVVVTHAACAGMLERSVGSLLDAGGLDRVVVVDNGGDRDAAVDLASRDRVEVVRSANRGYGAAANLGTARARELGAEAVALLNDDVVVEQGWLEPLMSELRAGERVGAAQPVLVTGAEVNSRGVAIGRDGAGIDLGRGEPVEALGTAPSDIELFTGGAVLMAMPFLDETGGFDERYFLYYEDVDLGRRGAALGWRYRVVPAVIVEHVGGATTGGDPGRTRYLQERNRLWAAFRFAGARTIGRAVWLSMRRLRHPPRDIHARALAAGIAGAPRRLRERRSAGR